MLEGIVSDVLVRVLGSYVDGLNRESIRIGVWRGDLELQNLRLRPDALAVLFESLGLDLPVTVTAGYIGLLRLEVPWKSLRSAPVRIFMHDVTVVASPVSDGDQSALELREKRLKAARLATDEAIRDAQFSVRSMNDGKAKNHGPYPKDSNPNNTSALDEVQQQGGYRIARWGWRFTSKFVTKIVDNIQVDVENVIVQYEDASSVRDRPYTATLAFDSLRACSTNSKWLPVFIESPSSPVVHKVVHMKGLVLNWEPGNSNNNLREWILREDVERERGKWSGFVQNASRHAIRPMDGELRIALTKSSAIASALAGTDDSLRELKNVPRVQLDLHFPDVRLVLDDFQYHTLLSTIMYLSDIDRKVRPQTARGRWLWALDRLLPRFKERREAALRFNAEGMRAFRESRERYCRVRNSVVRARRSGAPEPAEEAGELLELETKLAYDKLVLFRDIADRELYASLDIMTSNATTASRIWSFFSRRNKNVALTGDTGGEDSAPESISGNPTTEISASLDDPEVEAQGLNRISSSRSRSTSANDGDSGGSEVLETGSKPFLHSSDNASSSTLEQQYSSQEVVVPNFRMGFLLGRGSIQLKEGGYPTAPSPMSSLEFRELRIGIETRPGSGLLLEALLGTFEVIDLRKNLRIMYQRVPWAGDFTSTASRSHASAVFSETSVPPLDALPEGQTQTELLNEEKIDSKTSMDESGPLCAVLESYPHDITDAIHAIRGEYGLGLGAPGREQHGYAYTMGYRRGLGNDTDPESSPSFERFDTQHLKVKVRGDFRSCPTPLKYIAALRLNQEEVLDGDWAQGATRMAMDLAIGGMEVLLDGPEGAFISSVRFWHPREKMPSIMQFLAKSAAPRLATLRMDIQKAILERSVPMRMDILIRGPRFVMPARSHQNVSIVLDLGTFAMETATGPSETVLTKEARALDKIQTDSQTSQSISIRYTDYKMACTDLGLYLLSDNHERAAERVIRPFSLHLLLQVMHNSSFIEAVTMSHQKLSMAKVKLHGELPSLQISVSHDGFRNILKVAKGWGTKTKTTFPASGIEPNRAIHSLSIPAELEEIRNSHQNNENQVSEMKAHGIRSHLISFSMNLDFEDLQLELRDAMARRIVTIPSSGTRIKMTKRPDTVDFDFRVRSFTVIDGSRGATAPFRQIAYAGMEMTDIPSMGMRSPSEAFGAGNGQSFISLSYHGDLVRQEQSLSVRILSLHLVCVRETYFALADFFYLNESHSPAFQTQEKSNASASTASELRSTTESAEESTEHGPEDSQKGEGESEYSDPFAALGMTTSDAARALRDQAGRGMEISKQAFADRGKLSVNAELDGLVLTLVTAEGAIACFDVSDCRTELVQYANGTVEASGEVGGFGIRDLTSAFDVYSETVRYSRNTFSLRGNAPISDGWSLKVPKSKNCDIWLEARLRNVRIVYLHRFIVILKKYFDVLRESLRPVLEMKGGIAEVFDSEVGEDFPIAPSSDGRVRVRIITEDVDIVMPRHSQSPYEALRFVVSKSSITNDDLPTPGYRVGFEVKAEGVDAHVLYQLPAEGEGRALTEGGTEPTLKQITPDCPITDILPFARDISLVAKLDTWRRRRVPEVILNAEGIPVLKDGQEEREYDPRKWLPAIRVRVSAPNGISARLCEAEYSILYFTFTENIIERPDIEFTDIVRGLKTPILPTRKPVQPIMFSSNRMPPNYQILFEVPVVESVIMSGADGRDELAKLIRSELRDLVGSFEYGVDYRMTIDVSANMNSLQDARIFSKTHGMTLIMPTKEPTGTVSPHGENSLGSDTMSETARSVTLTWDRPFGFRANVMVVASDLRIIVEPELFRDLGALTAPGFPFLKSSAPPPLLRFNGRLLIVTISKPEIWLMANQYPGDGRALVIRGDVIAKVMWAAVTGRNTVEVAAHGVQVNLSSLGPSGKSSLNTSTSSQPSATSAYTAIDRRESETPMLYSCDVSLKFEGRGYDPPKKPGDKPRKAPGSTLSMNAESFLVRIDVNDAPLILAVASSLVRLKPSKLSQRPEQPGRFDQWIDKGEEGDSKLSVHFMLPHCRLMFTDETLGRYVPIMEARLRNGVLRSNIPWLTNAAFEFALDLFNEDKGWWEPGIEPFRLEFASSKGRSGSLAIHVRAERNIDVNVTPNTVSGAARVSKALKHAIEDLRTRLKREDDGGLESLGLPLQGPPIASGRSTASAARRPSVAAFCVRNETGRSMQMWLPYDSKRRSIRGNGGEIEVDTPSEEVLWTALGATGGLSTDPAMNRQLSMSCILALSGYEALTLSTEQTGSRLVRLIPDTTDNSNGGPGSLPTALTLVWAVTMRDGVPCGCIRSALRLVNRTRRLLEVNIGGIRKSLSLGNDMKITPSIQSFDSNIDCHGRIKPGEAWAVPIHSVFKVIRIRPHLLHASETSKISVNGKPDDPVLTNTALRYEFLWSEPISSLSSLYEAADDLRCNYKTNDISGVRSATSSLSAPLLSCRGADSRKVFCLAVHPIVDPATVSKRQMKDWISGSIDVQLCTPLVIENLLPRVVFMKLATPGDSHRNSTSKMIASKHIDPLSEAHIYGVGSDHSSLAIALGMDNSLDKKSRSLSKSNTVLPSRQTGSFHPKFLTLKSLSTGSGRYTPFKVMMEYDQTVASRQIRLYCRYWIRNRSDTDIFFKDREHARGSSVSNPKVFLRGRPPGVQADRYVCFSGGWISFQRRDATEDIWVPLGTEISEVDKPVSLNLEGLSLLVDVRPAKGKFHRSLVLTIRNSVWLQNRTGSVLQWCQPAALIPHGIALASKVHSVAPGMYTAVHWDFRTHKKSICFRRATEENSSDWMWSRPVLVEGVQGEFAAKMYRPKRHEQYIARVVISKLGNGVSAIVVNKEDRNTPPYRIVNNCHHRSIAFRQSGVNETLPWLVRPGRSTRYAWDDPQAPVKRRSLVVEVIEYANETINLPPARSISQHSLRLRESSVEDHDSVQQNIRKKPRETRYPKFELNIDMIAADIPMRKGKKFVPELKVSVHVDGPTKVVTFTDRVLPNSLGNLEPRKPHPSKTEETSVAADGGKSSATNVDVELFIKAIGISFVDANPTELAYLSVSGVHLRLDRFDGQQLIVCDIQDVQLDNQLDQCTWPVVLWSPPPPESNIPRDRAGSSRSDRAVQKPFFQFTVNGPYPSKSQSIVTFSGIFVALQQIELAADEDFVLRVWLYVTSLIEAVGGTNDAGESLQGHDGFESGITLFTNNALSASDKSEKTGSEGGHKYLSRIYVDNLELCPIKLSVSFTSSRTSSVAEQIGGFRSLIRTLVAVLGNVENAEFRFNALELQHVFDATSHFRSLIAEYYVSQVSNQKMVLLASNSLIGNPSALFDSIAIGTRDFFVEPANAKGSADFIASIGRGSSSLLTNTVGGLVGSLGEIPRAVAQGLETAVGDREYLAERDSIRGGRARVASSPAQGLFTGALSFGHGIASGAAGLIKDPLQGAAEEGPTGFLKGLGKGFIGGVLKPITGALDLIAEPAAGFRSMMVSERSKKSAEPVRPPRSFSGPSGNRMTSYNLRSALGHAIFHAVNRGDGFGSGERLTSWTYLVAVHSSASSDDVILFLWALLRRSTRSSHHAKFLIDAQGNPQKAEKLRVGLVTTKRLIIASLDGQVLWEHPLEDIIDSYVSLEARDYLMVGVRPVGVKAVVAPTWKRVRCGCMTSRDELNASLRKAIEELKVEPDFSVQHSAESSDVRHDDTKLRETSRNHRRDKSVEMVDMSFMENEDENMCELKTIHNDASNDGKRGTFANMKLPGRGEDTKDPFADDGNKVILKMVDEMMSTASARDSTAVRSTRLILANYTRRRLILLSAFIDSGRWVEEVPQEVPPRSAVKFEADGTRSRVTDVAGRIIFCFDEHTNVGVSLAIRFLNPLLAPNAYALKCPPGYAITRNGGEKGDHVTTILSLRDSDNVGPFQNESISSRTASAAAEPLLFGRSRVSPHLPPITFIPPHAAATNRPNPNDPSKIAQLVSLGFSENEAKIALQENDADISKSYSALMDNKNDE